MIERLSNGRKRPKDFDGSRADFLRSGYEVFAEKGYHRTSVDEIVKRAARSKGGFYHHFKSKEEMYLEIFDQMLKSTGEKILQQFNSGRKVREILTGLIDHYEPMMTDPQRLGASVDFYHMAIRNENVRKVILQLHRQSVEMGEKLFQEAISRGEFAPIADINAVVDMIFSAGRGLMVMSVILDNGEGLPLRLKTFVDQQLRALEVPKRN
jgi:AcrR family transcriptional regulator